MIYFLLVVNYSRLFLITTGNGMTSLGYYKEHQNAVVLLALGAPSRISLVSSPHLKVSIMPVLP